MVICRPTRRRRGGRRDFDTAKEFRTVNGTIARGGSIDVGGPAIAEGIVLTTSGYGLWGGQSGNVLVAFSVEGK
jgi:polyvinyl alcohol dehydrogenase (cytochrome)